MRVFNTGAGDFWRSRIGEQLRWLKLTTPQYHRAAITTVLLVEKVARGMLPWCRRFGQWPEISLRRGAVSFEFRARGEITVDLGGTKISYVPDPIRKSSTLGMVLDTAVGKPESIDKFLRGVCWHLLEVRP